MRPDRCDPDVYENGEGIFVVANISPEKIEGWVGWLAVVSGQRVDWHYVGGRGVVRALGDLGAVRRAISVTLPQLEAAVAPERVLWNWL